MRVQVVAASLTAPAAMAPARVSRVTVVYAACGEAAARQLLVALTSMYHMAQRRGVTYLAVILTDGAVLAHHLRPFESR
jgi:hypothetical protein